MTKEEKKEYDKKYRSKNIDKIKEKKKNSYIKNKKEILLKQKEYAEKNKEKIKERSKKRYLENKEAIALKAKKFRLQNRERLLEIAKKYQQEHKENRRIYIRKYNKEKEKNNIAFKIKNRLSHRINQAVSKKWGNTIELTGCSKEFLLKYLESQFKEGMSFDNYGEWHIDHIKPCSSFDLSLEEEQKKCFHYTNLQPLWAIDNLKKGAKFDGKLIIEDNNE